MNATLTIEGGPASQATAHTGSPSPRFPQLHADPEILNVLVSGALDKLPVGLWLLDASRRPLLTNSLGRDLLLRGWPGRLADERIDFTCPRARSLLSQISPMVREASVESEHAHHGRVLVSASALESDTVLFIVVDECRALTRARKWLMQEFALTEREAYAAVLVASAVPLKRASALMQVKLNTLRTHLANAFIKAGIRRQAELVRLVTLRSFFCLLDPDEREMDGAPDELLSRLADVRKEN